MRLLGLFLVVIGVAGLVAIQGLERATDGYTAQAQAALAEQLTTTTTAPRVTIPQPEQLRDDDPTFAPPPSQAGPGDIRYSVHTPPVPPPPLGEPLGVLTFPTLDMEWIVVEGVGVEELKLGPGHMPWTPLPGSEGNAVISGHRTTYGGPFHDLHLLEPGDPIVFEGTTYTVTETLIVAPTDVWVTEDRGEGKHLTLTTCNPIGSARERLIVFAAE